MNLRLDIDDLRNVISDLEKKIEQLANDTATQLCEGLKAATPVRTGTARDGWTVELGENPVVENLVPYIGKLNDGSSPQAPAGFVELEMQKVVRGE